ncbi:MAG: zf-HC2 domain-containing protein, partial [Acidimicrobiales bacterium]
MRCDDARPAASARIDGELPDDVDATELDDHLAGCRGCADFGRSLARVRAELRFEPVDAATDVAPAVIATLAAQRQRHGTRAATRPRGLAADD